MDKLSCGLEPEQLVLIDASTAQPVEGLVMPSTQREQVSNAPLKLQFNLGPIGPRLNCSFNGALETCH